MIIESIESAQRSCVDCIHHDVCLDWAIDEGADDWETYWLCGHFKENKETK